MSQEMPSSLRGLERGWRGAESAPLEAPDWSRRASRRVICETPRPQAGGGAHGPSQPSPLGSRCQAVSLG